jgi:hypothetical protein
VIRSVGVEPLLYSARGYSQNLASRGGLDGFEIYAIRGAPPSSVSDANLANQASE